MSNATVSTLVSLLVVALVARRELRPTTQVAGRLWVRPAILAVITLALAALGAYEGPDRIASLVGWTIGGIVVGAATGVALLRCTSIRPAEQPNAIVAQGSLVTLAMWLVVLAIRVVARVVFGGTSAASNLDASVGTVAVVAAASVVLASAFHRAIASRQIAP
jgi:hypothetical protein